MGESYSRSGESQEQKFQRDLKSYDHGQDLFKHLATLDTGSILLLVTFLEKIFANPKWKFLVIVSLIGFTSSAAATILAQTLSVLDLSLEEEWLNNPWINVPCLLFAFGGFLIGLISLVVFACKNLIA